MTVEAVAVPGQAEVRWNAIDGPVLARPSGPNFSVAITIPEVEEGLYALIVVGRGPDGSVGATGRSAFLVTGDSGRSPERSRPAVESDESSDGTPPGLLWAGGAGLAAFGGIVGSFLTSRRRRTGPSVDGSGSTRP